MLTVSESGESVSRWVGESVSRGVSESDESDESVIPSTQT